MSFGGSASRNSQNQQQQQQYNNTSQMQDTLGVLPGMLESWNSSREGNDTGIGFLTQLIKSASGDVGGPIQSNIDHTFAQRSANAISGPQFQQMGGYRQGVAQGQGIAQAQRDVIGQSQQAAQALIGNNAAQTGLLQPYQRTNSSGTSSGTGSSNGSQTGFQGGVTLCCFIMLEGLNGELPWFVRKIRDEEGARSPEMVAGYRRLSAWLVPAMRTFDVVKRVVNALLVRPLVDVGAGMVGKGPVRWWHGPVRETWFQIFKSLAK